uniref:Putative lipocalin n=1 Tax=Ixodes ricinus TaxID=34613 RepID=V5IC28_IXORI
MKLVLSLAVFVCGVLVGASGEMAVTTRRGRLRGGITTFSPESDLSKLGEQNATRVVQMNATQWVKWRTYNVTDIFGSNRLQCENFKIMKKRTPTNYSLQYNYRSGYSWKTISEDPNFGISQTNAPSPKLTCFCA